MGCMRRCNKFVINDVLLGIFEPLFNYLLVAKIQRIKQKQKESDLKQEGWNC